MNSWCCLAALTFLVTVSSTVTLTANPPKRHNPKTYSNETTTKELSAIVTSEATSTRGTRRMRRSTGLKSLPSEACNSSSSFALPYGNYEVFKTEIALPYYDEGRDLTITCKLTEKAKSCGKWVKSALRNTTLEINGISIRDDDDNYIPKYDPSNRMKTFKSTLSYKLHNNMPISCVARPYRGQGVLVSRNPISARVFELYNYTIEPSEMLEMVIGEATLLTCRASSIRGFNHIGWKFKEEGQLKWKFYGQDRDRLLRLRVKNFNDSLTSILNVTTITSRKFKSPVEYIFSCFVDKSEGVHTKQVGAYAAVRVIPVDTSSRDALLAAGVCTTILAVVLIIFLIRRRQRLQSALAVVS